VLLQKNYRLIEETFRQKFILSSYYDELAAMQMSGMSTWSLLQASTINGAKAVGKEK